MSSGQQQQQQLSGNQWILAAVYIGFMSTSFYFIFFTVLLLKLWNCNYTISQFIIFFTVHHIFHNFTNISCLFFLSFWWSHRLVALADKFGAPPSSYQYLTLARGMCYARAGCLWLWSRVRQRKRQLGPPDKATSYNGPYSSVCCATRPDFWI